MRLEGLQPKREDLAVLLFVTALGAVVTFAVERAGGPVVGIADYLPNLRIYLLALLAFICLAVPWLLIRYRPEHPTRFLIDGPPARALWARIAAGLPLIVAVALFMPSFSLIKATLPLFNAYVWDARFIALDQGIHGTDPWRLLHPVFGHPLMTAALAQVYHAWFLLIYAGTLFFALLVDDRTLRYRYFLSYFALWTIGGMAMAAGFASVGPCFLEPLLGNSHFADQMAGLQAVNRQYPVAVLEVQRDLISWYFSGDHRLGRGISAMPSMHVALAFLFFLAVRHVSRLAGWFFGAFCALIAIGSVHLGYHYAVDGYVALGLAAAIWFVAGKLAPRLVTPPASSSEPMEATVAAARA